MTLCSKDGCTFKIQRIAPAGHMMPLDITIPTILKQEKHRSTQTFSHAGVNDIEWCPKASVSKEALASFVRLPPCYQCYLIWRIHFAIFVSLASRHCRPRAFSQLLRGEKRPCPATTDLRALYILYLECQACESTLPILATKSFAEPLHLFLTVCCFKNIYVYIYTYVCIYIYKSYIVTLFCSRNCRKVLVT